MNNVPETNCPTGGICPDTCDRTSLGCEQIWGPDAEHREALVRLGKAKVSWGAKHYGRPTIIANAPVTAIDDLVAAISKARTRIKKSEEGHE